MTIFSRGALIAFLLFCAGSVLNPVSAQAPDSEEPSEEKADSTKKEKTFRDIITDEAVSMEGMLTVHELDDKFYFEIPESLFGREIIAITRIAKAPTGAGYGGEQANRQVIRFEKGPKKNVFIRVINYVNVPEDSSGTIATAVENSNMQPIAAAFDIEATRPDTSVLIDVTSFFNDPNQAMNVPPRFQQTYKLKGLAKDRSYIQSIRTYPINVEVRAVKTYEVNPPSINPSNGPSRTRDLVSGMSAGAVTFELNTSFVLLPEEPMRRRLHDPRVGIFSTAYTVFGDEQQRVETDRFTVRWRLEAKSDADAQRQRNGELIEPAKPIVFYIDPATPEKWRPFLKEGVEDWQVAFEQAGWRNAIQAKDWPENDTTMSLEDARFSVIRYFASPIQNAYGPNVHDPRTGEIIESHIGWYHNVMQLLKNWYTIQTAAVDPRARVNEFDDELMGQLIRFVSAHEVGHTLGLQHNFGASSATPVEKLRDPEWLAENNHTSSIMDYARFNYVAQPEDGVTNLFPGIGAYDKWAIEWNYKPIYGTPDDEADKKELNAWYKEKAEPDPALHFLIGNDYDPRAQTEDLGDDAMVASEYGIANLKRILPQAIEWTAEDAEHYERAEEIYDQVFTQYRRYLGHVTKWVGGLYQTPKTYDQEGVVFEPVPRDKQSEAILFMQKHLFQTPEWLMDPELTQYFKNDFGVNTLANVQRSTLNNLFSTDRLQRIIESSARFSDAYTLENLFDQVEGGIWTEARGANAADVFRRNLQKIHLAKMIDLLEPQDPSPGFNSMYYSTTPSVDPVMSDIRSLAVGKLKELHETLERAVKRTDDDMTRYHYEDCKMRIEEALDMD